MEYLPLADGEVTVRRRKPGLSEGLVSLLLGGSLALAAVAPKSFGILLALLLALALFSTRPREVAKLRLQDLLFLIILNSYPLLVAINMLIHGVNDASQFDNPSRFLLLSVVYIAFRARPFEMRYVVVGAMIGCGLTFGASLLHVLQGAQVMQGSHGRYVGSQNAVVFAQVAFFSLLVATTPIKFSRVSDSQQCLLLVTVVLMASASLLVSQSRWVLLALLGLYAYLILFDLRLPASRLTRTALLFIPVCATAFLLNSPHVYHLAGTAAEFAANLGHIDQTTSLGQRLALWSSSWHLIIEKPLWGFGVGQFRQALNSLPEAAALTDTVRGYGHAHNEYLQLAVEQGLVGLGLFLVAIAGMLFITLREGFAADARHLLLGTVICWMFFGLTQAQLAHQKTTVMFALLLALGFSQGMNGKYGALNESQPYGGLVCIPRKARS